MQRGTDSDCYEGVAIMQIMWEGINGAVDVGFECYIDYCGQAERSWSWSLL